ncbi:transposase family protein [Desulfovibrio sp. UIB00]|nr:transposase family protein [Desulfovibrio sp. UIB00]
MCNNEVVAHAISFRNGLALALAILDKLTAKPGAVVHSDQGFQYTHNLYHNQHEALRLQRIHSRKGSSLDNAWVESFFSYLEAEIFLEKSVQSKANQYFD